MIAVNEFKLSDLKVGQTETVIFRPTKEMVDQYAKLSGDFSPIHVDLDYCKSIGIDHVIVHGLFTASAVSRLVGMNLPGKHAKLLQVNLSWPKPVLIDDDVKVSGEVQEISEATKTITLKILGSNQRGEKVLKGLVIVGVGL